MKLSTHLPGSKRARRLAACTGTLAVLLSAGLAVTLVTEAAATAAAVPLGTAGSFAVLAGAGITNTGPTTLNGDVGTYPTLTITGDGTMTVNGTNHHGDNVTQSAKTDLVTAYNAAAGEGPTSPIAADLGGMTLSPGVYNSASSIKLTGTLTLNGGGNENSVFVFQAGSALTTESASNINLVDGAQSCHVFWQIGSSATLGTGSMFRGTIVALTSITVTTGVSVTGRVLARNGAVTLDSDTITAPACATAPTTTTAAPATTTTTTPKRTTTTTTAPKRTTTTTTPKRTTTTTTTPRRTTTTTAPLKQATTTTTAPVRRATTTTTAPVRRATTTTTAPVRRATTTTTTPTPHPSTTTTLPPGTTTPPGNAKPPTSKPPGFTG
jgi:hypothetical protein